MNDFETIVGADPHTLQTSFVVTRDIYKGETYVFMYRAINAIGAGPWSEMVMIKAAKVPESPPKPAYLSSTDDSITLSFT